MAQGPEELAPLVTNTPIFYFRSGGSCPTWQEGKASERSDKEGLAHLLRTVAGQKAKGCPETAVWKEPSPSSWVSLALSGQSLGRL